MDIELTVTDEGAIRIVYVEPYDDAETFTDTIDPDHALALAFKVLRAALPQLREFDRLTHAIADAAGEGYADLVDERDEVADEICKTITGH